ncbi:MAG: hypothetical protein DHS20C17_23590 [Cyclobacteriaceae bacterium]|nr:MAG: hypothetical protein DHS20C17_23590 [Cyclobacteriaceae bacterium]
MNRELSKKYLAGTLSAKESYQIEDRLLENDFCFEAMEGLEQIPWDQCQKHMEAIEAKIVEEFSLEPRPTLSRNIAIGLTGLLTTIAAIWYFNNSPSETIDLTNDKPAITSTAPVRQPDLQSIEAKTPIIDTTTTVEVPPKQEIIETKPAAEKKTLAIKPASRSSSSKKPQNLTANDVLTHITVGRVVDTKGIPIQDALVSSGAISDTTDKSGYYALKIPEGGTRIIVTHLATKYSIEIDTNQNWEIVLDIVGQAVQDYYPMNAANRFK